MRNFIASIISLVGFPLISRDSGGVYFISTSSISNDGLISWVICWESIFRPILKSIKVSIKVHDVVSEIGLRLYEDLDPEAGVFKILIYIIVQSNVL